MQGSIVVNDGEANITIFANGKVYVAHSTHPNYERIREGFLSDDDTVLDLFDVSVAVGQKFERLSERVTVSNGRLYFDGVEVENVLAKQVIRFMNEGVQPLKYMALVNFFDNVMQNPQEHSREQLYDWLDKHEFTITPDGMIVGYKGVRALSNDEFESISSGTAIVNGETQTGRIKQKVGDIVEMPRSEVAFDPSVGCSTGLHVGNYRYANSFAEGALLEVHVNPRDVVSVPTDSNWEKVRVCRYKVIGTLEAEYSSPVLWSEDYVDEYGEEPFENGCTNCGWLTQESLYDGLCKECYDEEYGNSYEIYTCDHCLRELDDDHDHGDNNECLCVSCYNDQVSSPPSVDEPDILADDQAISDFEWGY